MTAQELADKIGFTELGADLWGATFKGAITTDALLAIRDAVLENAATLCDSCSSRELSLDPLRTYSGNDVKVAVKGSCQYLAAGIRQMKH